MTDPYAAFLARKRKIDPDTGIADPGDMPAFLFPHQADITRWALRRGRAAVFAGTGLGKTLIELEWADRVSVHTRKPVLILAPLAVSVQHIREAERFGIQAKLARSDIDIDREGVLRHQLSEVGAFRSSMVRRDHPRRKLDPQIA
jgi:superfamily II DNA or RNA helicase